MNFTIRKGFETTIEDFMGLLELDKKAFGIDVITNEGLAQSRYLKNPEGLVTIYDRERLVGGTFVFPISNSLVDEMLKLNKCMDDNISPDDVKVFEKGKSHNVLYLDLVVDSDYRGKGLGERLYLEIIEWLRQKGKEGFYIKNLYAYTISDGGFAIPNKLSGLHVIGEVDNSVLLTINRTAFEV